MSSKKAIANKTTRKATGSYRNPTTGKGAASGTDKKLARSAATGKYTFTGEAFTTKDVKKSTAAKTARRPVAGRFAAKPAGSAAREIKGLPPIEPIAGRVEMSESLKALTARVFQMVYDDYHGKKKA